MLGGYRGIAVVDGYAVYEVLARDGPDLTLAHCWAHTKRKYDDIADHWPTACAEIHALIGDLYAIERLVPRPFPGSAEMQARPAPTAAGASQPDPRSDLALGHGPSRLAPQRFRQSRALHARALDGTDTLCRRPAHSA